MFDRCEPVLDVQFGIEFFEHLVVKLFVIVSDDSMKKSKPTNDRLLEEYLNFALYDICQEFCLHLFDEVVDSDEQIFSLARCWKK